MFWSSLKSVFLPQSSGPSLLSHFPSLILLCILDVDLAFTVTSRMIKELSRFCSLLTGYQLEARNDAIIPKFFKNRFTGNGNNNNVSEITFKYKYTTVEAITVILLHQTSLTTVAIYYCGYHVDIERKEIIPVSDHFRASGHYLQLIPRSYPKLQATDLHYNEMDRDVDKQGEWVCKNLSTLPVRIEDPDTKDNILKAVTLWRVEYRSQWQKKMTGATTVAEENA